MISSISICGQKANGLAVNRLYYLNILVYTSIIGKFDRNCKKHVYDDKDIHYTCYSNGNNNGSDRSCVF
jgi:hypothetical protein